MSGGDDFRTQHRDKGMGDDRNEPEPLPREILLLVRIHGPDTVRKWLDLATERYNAEKKQRQSEERREEIERLEKVAKDGDAAKKRLAQLVTQEMNS